MEIKTVEQSLHRPGQDLRVPRPQGQNAAGKIPMTPSGIETATFPLIAR